MDAVVSRETFSRKYFPWGVLATLGHRGTGQRRDAPTPEMESWETAQGINLQSLSKTLGVI